jgi:hypothetical protein
MLKSYLSVSRHPPAKHRIVGLFGMMLAVMKSFSQCVEIADD